MLRQRGEAVHLSLVLGCRGCVGHAQNVVGQGSGARGHERGRKGEKGAGVEGNLAQVAGHVSHGGGDGGRVGAKNQVQVGVGGGVADGPLESVEHVALHLAEHVLLVGTAAHVFEVRDCGHTALFVLVLGGDPQTGAADELVVLLVHDSLGAVAVNEVDGQEEGLGLEPQGDVGLDDKVQQVGAHVPLELGLEVHHGRLGQRLVLHPGHVGDNVVSVLGLYSARDGLLDGVEALGRMLLGRLCGGVGSLELFGDK